MGARGSLVRIARLFSKIFTVAVMLAALGSGVVAYYGIDDGRPSVCVGGVVGGHLINGKRLPLSGANFTAYHIAGYMAGRTFMHGLVRDAVLDAYKALEESAPEQRYVYAEAGWPFGGKFIPHRSHSNGTSVDFMVPLRTDRGAMAQVPASLFNRLGYDVKFDDDGKRDGLSIDFEAVAQHLTALDKAVRGRGIKINRVIFEPSLQRHLFKTASGQALSQRLPFMDRTAWVRHDQHYHVDFSVPCR